mgnify:CR=1 FL=1
MEQLENFESSPDCAVESHGTIFLFRLLSEAARRWVCDNVAGDPQYWGGALVVEHRYAQELAHGMSLDGLRLV